MTAINLQPSHAYRREYRHRPAIEALGDAAQWVLSVFGEWRRRMSEREELAKLDNRTLADIGLTRADAEFLINKPFWRE
jgi:uncharacterized protein YjiS (DUF1127 family)